MKKIGFVDYYLSEWHANKYPAWIQKANEALGTDYTVAYAWAELDVSPQNGVTSAEWCEKYGTTLCASLEELCEKSDVILVLAPSDPDRHLPYARTVLSYGKPTYIDKTFAPCLADAEEIFALAKQYGTPFFSTSALRYADELKDLDEVSNLIVTGGGGNLPEYLIHQVEMAVMLLQDPAQNVVTHKQGTQVISHVTTLHGAGASFVFDPKLPFTVAAELADGTHTYRTINSDFFFGLIEDILRFYETQSTSFDPAQTLEVMHMRDMILNSLS